MVLRPVLAPQAEPRVAAATALKVV
jgi:hypothetical protein